jgi:hypothetical protein
MTLASRILDSYFSGMGGTSNSQKAKAIGYKISVIAKQSMKKISDYRLIQNLFLSCK